VPHINQWLQQGRMSDGSRGFAPFRSAGDDGKKKKRSKFEARRTAKALKKSKQRAPNGGKAENNEKREGAKPQGIMQPAVSWLKDLLPTIEEDDESSVAAAAVVAESVFSDAEHRRLKAKRVHERLTALEQEFAVTSSGVTTEAVNEGRIQVSIASDRLSAVTNQLLMLQLESVTEDICKARSELQHVHEERSKNEKLSLDVMEQTAMNKKGDAREAALQEVVDARNATSTLAVEVDQKMEQKLSQLEKKQFHVMCAIAESMAVQQSNDAPENATWSHTELGLSIFVGNNQEESVMVTDSRQTTINAATKQVRQISDANLAESKSVVKGKNDELDDDEEDEDETAGVGLKSHVFAKLKTIYKTGLAPAWLTSNMTGSKAEAIKSINTQLSAFRARTKLERSPSFCSNCNGAHVADRRRLEKEINVTRTEHALLEARLKEAQHTLNVAWIEMLDQKIDEAETPLEERRFQAHRLCVVWQEALDCEAAAVQQDLKVLPKHQLERCRRKMQEIRTRQQEVRRLAWRILSQPESFEALEEDVEFLWQVPLPGTARKPQTPGTVRARQQALFTAARASPRQPVTPHTSRSTARPTARVTFRNEVKEPEITPGATGAAGEAVGAKVGGAGAAVPGARDAATTKAQNEIDYYFDTSVEEGPEKDAATSTDFAPQEQPSPETSPESGRGLMQIMMGFFESDGKSDSPVEAVKPQLINEVVSTASGKVTLPSAGHANLLSPDDELENQSSGTLLSSQAQAEGPTGPTEEDTARSLNKEILALQEQILGAHRSQRAELKRLAEQKDIEAKILGDTIKAKRQAKHTEAAASLGLSGDHHKSAEASIAPQAVMAGAMAAVVGLTTPRGDAQEIRENELRQYSELADSEQQLECLDEAMTEAQFMADGPEKEAALAEIADKQSVASSQVQQLSVAITDSAESKGEDAGSVEATTAAAAAAGMIAKLEAAGIQGINLDILRLDSTLDANALRLRSEEVAQLAKGLRASGHEDLAAESEASSKQMFRASISMGISQDDAQHEAALASLAAARIADDEGGDNLKTAAIDFSAEVVKMLEDADLEDEAKDVALLVSQMDSDKLVAAKASLLEIVCLSKNLHNTGAITEAASVDELIRRTELVLAEFDRLRDPGYNNAYEDMDEGEAEQDSESVRGAVIPRSGAATPRSGASTHRDSQQSLMRTPRSEIEAYSRAVADIKAFKDQVDLMPAGAERTAGKQKLDQQTEEAEKNFGHKATPRTIESRHQMEVGMRVLAEKKQMMTNLQAELAAAEAELENAKDLEFEAQEVWDEMHQVHQQAMADKGQADTWLSDAGYKSKVELLQKLQEEATAWGKLDEGDADDEGSREQKNTPWYKLKAADGKVLTEQANFGPKGMYRESCDAEDEDGNVTNWQLMFYTARHEADCKEAEVLAFRNSYIPEEEEKLEQRYNALIKVALKRGEFSDLEDCEFILSGGTDTHWQHVIIIVAANMPPELVDDLKDGEIDDGLNSRHLQFIGLSMDDLVKTPYVLVFVETPKPGERPRVLTAKCIETLFQPYTHKYVRNLQRVIIVHGNPPLLSIKKETIAGAEVEHIQELGELFDFDRDNFFNPMELVFPDFVYGYEGSCQTDFIDKMETAVSERGFYRAHREMEED